MTAARTSPAAIRQSRVARSAPRWPAAAAQRVRDVRARRALRSARKVTVSEMSDRHRNVGVAALSWTPAQSVQTFSLTSLTSLTPLLFSLSREREKEKPPAAARQEQVLRSPDLVCAKPKPSCRAPKANRRRRTRCVRVRAHFRQHPLNGPFCPNLVCATTRNFTVRSRLPWACVNFAGDTRRSCSAIRVAMGIFLKLTAFVRCRPKRPL